ncbi:hypothetical protein PZA11_006615 [Diplocarpon coronariae]
MTSNLIPLKRKHSVPYCRLTTSLKLLSPNYLTFSPSYRPLLNQVPLNLF